MANTDLNSQNTFHYVLRTKTYLMKVYFNLRSLLIFAPTDKKVKKAVRRFAAVNSGNPDPNGLWSKKAAEMMQQYYKYTRLQAVFDEAAEKYEGYYDSVAALVPKFKHVKEWRGWRIKPLKKKERIFAFAKTANELFDKNYNSDVNRLLFLRSKAMNITMEGAWNAYLKDSDRCVQGLENFL